MPHENSPRSHSPEDETSLESDFSEPRAERTQDTFDSVRDRLAETPSGASPVERLTSSIEQLDAVYRERLAELYLSCLQGMKADEIQFIRGDEELRNKTAYALQELEIEGKHFNFGEYYVSPYVARDPDIAWLALELNARAQQVDDVFQAKAAEIAQATGALHLPGEVKDVNRISEKLELDYRSRHGYEVADVHQLAPMVKDAARCRLVIQGDPTTEDQPIIDQIETSGLTIARDALDRPSIKRGFVDHHSGEPLDIESGTRYRDTKVTVTVEVPTRDGGVTLCEIAIVTPEMSTATVSEHPLYEITRSLEDDERPLAATLLHKLREVQEQFYGEVSQQISNRLSAT